MIPAANIHGTAIVVGSTGLLFTGPSGAGKSAVALHCIGQARARGLFSALVSDDQVLVSADTSGRIVASAPETIAGLLELRGAGILAVPAVETAELHLALRPLHPPIAERLPPAGETFEALPGLFLPLTRLPLFPGCCAFGLLCAIHPEILGR